MKTILDTGCSSGFGLETARHFLERDWNVVATMRTPREGVLPRSERLRVLAPVVSAEKQLSLVREQDADVRLRATAIAEIQGGQRPGGGYSSGHVAFLVIVPPAPASGWLGCCLSLQNSTTPTPASAFPSPSRVRHKRKPHWQHNRRCG